MKVFDDRHQVYDGAKATLELGSGNVGLSSVCPGWKGRLNIKKSNIKYQNIELGSGKVGLSSVCPGWKGSLRIESTHCKIIRHAMLVVKGLS